MYTRQYGKSLLQGMDFGKLEETAMLHVRQNVTGSDNYGVFATLAAMQNGITGWNWGDDFYPYISPPPHLKSQVDKIIDKFWAYPGEGHMYLYLEQLRKNPITKDLFKGESTTHHYPWYRRGTKY